MGYSTVIFSDFGSFLKMTVTQKIEVGINSNLLHSISTSICIKECVADYVSATLSVVVHSLVQYQL